MLREAWEKEGGENEEEMCTGTNQGEVEMSHKKTLILFYAIPLSIPFPQMVLTR